MGLRTEKNRHPAKADMKQVLGRIFRHRHPSDETEQPFLLAKDGQVKVPLQDLVDCVVAHLPEDDSNIVAHMGVRGVRPADIEIVRSYIHRFGSDVAHPLPIAAHQNRELLLDENTPQPAMLYLSKIFGWSTHVAAEELAGRDTPDQDIWDYASSHHFGAIVTRDTDFLHIQKESGGRAVDEGRGEDVPLLLFVPENLTTGMLCGMFRRYAADIRDFMQGEVLACQLTHDAGCSPLF